ncbi:MAG: hypothetical protein JOY59_06100 [Candidatus Eremiobacteraeota bacterium]|nr:hypothetical protein [Candidatus Eremiobacteraeota bacterium]
MPKALAAAIAAFSLLAGTVAAAPGGDLNPSPDDMGCGVSGGTLTMLATDNDSDFAAFSLQNAQGDEMAQQFIPTFSQDASAELMLTKIGFGGLATVASVKCLADSSVKRCADPKWQPPDQGVGVALAGMLIGADWFVVSIKGHYVNTASPIAGSIDGSAAGFELDDSPVRWSAFYDSQTEASQAFFDVKGGPHKLTIGSRDPDKDAFVPQDRLCFST